MPDVVDLGTTAPRHLGAVAGAARKRSSVRPASVALSLDPLRRRRDAFEPFDL